jgi:zinc transport system substrate-binding protein
VIEKFLLASAVILAVALSGCLSQNVGEVGSTGERIEVVTTISPLAEFINAVGGEKVSVSVLVPPGAEPHTFEPAPSQIKQIEDADLYVENGAGLEFWMKNLIGYANETSIIDSSKGVQLESEEGGEDDPHIWLSLRNAEVQVRNICDGLVGIDPANKAYYEENRDVYLQKLAALDSQLEENFSRSEMKSFVVHHPAWTYFARDYGLNQIPLMENEKEPGPKYLAEVVEQAKDLGIKTIFVEPEFNPKSAEVIAREINCTVTYIDPLAGNYLENMQYAGSEIAKSMA